MRFWDFWLNRLLLSSQYEPVRFIEFLMLLLTLLLLGIWGITQQLPYILLCLSYAIGASISMLVREAIAPSPQTKIFRLIALSLLLVSLYGFIDFL
jgi:multisubunit Na+/H+ antiporter MnhE subunit